MSCQHVQLPASSFGLAACPIVWNFFVHFPHSMRAQLFCHSCIIFGVLCVHSSTAFLVISNQVVCAHIGGDSIDSAPSPLIFFVTRCGQPRRFHLGRLQSWSGLSTDAPPSSEIHCHNFRCVFILWNWFCMGCAFFSLVCHLITNADPPSPVRSCQVFFMFIFIFIFRPDTVSPYEYIIHSRF